MLKEKLKAKITTEEKNNVLLQLNNLLEEQLNLTQIKEKLILENKNLTSNQKETNTKKCANSPKPKKRKNDKCDDITIEEKERMEI